MNKKQSNVTHLRQSYQIKIVLEHIKPPIWRRLQVDSRITLADLHDAIQVSFGWLDMHLHQFADRDKIIYREPDEDSFLPESGGIVVVDEMAVLLSEVLKKEKDWLKYDYDFGDGWSHKIILEKIIPFKKNQFPVLCLKGVRACPPEDCGGPWGYQNMLEHLTSGDEAHHAELMEWLDDGFDAEYFNLRETNSFLREMFEDVTFNSKPGLENELRSIEPLEPFDFPYDEFAFDRNDLLNDPETPPEVKDLLHGIKETMEIFGAMDAMLDQAVEAFEEIVKISKDKKVTAIAKKMIQLLDED